MSFSAMLAAKFAIVDMLYCSVSKGVQYNVRGRVETVRELVVEMIDKTERSSIRIDVTDI